MPIPFRREWNLVWYLLFNTSLMHSFFLFPSSMRHSFHSLRNKSMVQPWVFVCGTFFGFPVSLFCWDYYFLPREPTQKQLKKHEEIIIIGPRFHSSYIKKILSMFRDHIFFLLYAKNKVENRVDNNEVHGFCIFISHNFGKSLCTIKLELDSWRAPERK